MPDLTHRDASVDEEQISGGPAPRQFVSPPTSRFLHPPTISAKSPTRQQRSLTGTEGSNPLRSANESLSVYIGPEMIEIRAPCGLIRYRCSPEVVRTKC